MYPFTLIFLMLIMRRKILVFHNLYYFMWKLDCNLLSNHIINRRVYAVTNELLEVEIQIL